MDMLTEKMLDNVNNFDGFLLDGFPRDLEQARKFEEEVAPCKAVFFYEVTDKTMKKRLLKRGTTSGRVDDNEETITKRIQTFHENTEPVAKFYEDGKKLIRVGCQKVEKYANLRRLVAGRKGARCGVYRIVQTAG